MKQQLAVWVTILVCWSRLFWRCSTAGPGPPYLVLEYEVSTVRASLARRCQSLATDAINRARSSVAALSVSTQALVTGERSAV